MATALAELGVASAADLGKLKFGFNSGAGHEPRVAFLAEAWRQAFGLETEQIGSDFSVFLDAAHGRRVHRSPVTAGVPTTRTRTTSSACSSAAAATTTASGATTDFDALMAQAAAEPDQDKQVALYKQAQTILIDDAAVLPLRFGADRLRGPAVRRRPDRHPVGLAVAGRHVLRDHPDPEALVAPGDQSGWAGPHGRPTGRTPAHPNAHPKP